MNNRSIRNASVIIFLIATVACNWVEYSPTRPPMKTLEVDTPTPFQPVLPTKSPLPTITPTQEILQIVVDQSVPLALASQIDLPNSVVFGSRDSSVRLDVLAEGDIKQSQSVTWVYALVAPFPTTLDGVSLDQLKALWRGEDADLSAFQGKPIILSESTLESFAQMWGEPSGEAVKTLPSESLLEEAWNNSLIALIEFQEIEPRWKVLQVDGESPIEEAFDYQTYPLSLRYGWVGEVDQISKLEEATTLPPGNFDPDKMSVVVMTGVTALTRATGWKMELNGMEYPAGDILPWLVSADILHISNEVSFNVNCGPANPSQPNLMFCSDPQYIALLDYIGVDVVELSGNHNLDRGMDAFVYSLNLYRERNWGVYVGGMNLDEARKPLLMEHNGNKIAFLGCNLAGPERVWATDETPGEAPCDYDFIDGKLRELRWEGYLPIFTYQYYESYSPSASTPQKEDFRARASAGAVIVQGSQAHRPQGMEFANGAFIHHGLGNLFFDQMEVEGVTGTRDEFIDRHIIYDGRYINVQLLTAKLEDYSRPRPMNVREREEFLSQMFDVSGW